MIFLNVTNSYVTKAKTGIQRVVKNLIENLPRMSNYKPVIIQDEQFFTLGSDDLDAFIQNADFELKNPITLNDFDTGDIFFDIDGSWGDRYDMAQIFAALKKRGVIIFKMHYDAVPILCPSFSHENTVFRYVENFIASINYVDHWICISKVVEADLLKLFQKYNAGFLSSSVLNLGSNITNHEYNIHELDADVERLILKDYILSVGTVEVRKNYALNLEVFDKLCEKHSSLDVDLVIVGKEGWNNDEVINRLKNEAAKQERRVHWLKNASDLDLEALYRNARVNLNLSHYEGYGLPVAEALAKGVPVVCTAGGAMEEVGNGYADCVPHDVDTIISALLLYLPPNDIIRIKDFTPVNWSESAEHLQNIVDDFLESSDFKYLPEQAVYISIRPESVHRSLQSVMRHMAFIKKVVILTNNENYSEMINATKELPITITILKEEDLIDQALPDDHQSRNTFLRFSLYQSGAVEKNFIALDDDSIVINDVDVTKFSRNGKHIGYYFYENGEDWLGAFPSPTSFDKGLFRTIEFLKLHGYDVRLYNSHQPQIINKKLALHILKTAMEYGLDEWSIYFNIAKFLKPDHFADTIYECAGWPPNFASWLPSMAPEVLNYFNDFPNDISHEESVKVAANWKSALIDAQKLAASIQPGTPALFINQEGATLTENTIQCLPGTVLFVPVFTKDVSLRHLTYRFLSYKIDYVGENIPNMLHIPITPQQKNDMIDVHIEIGIDQNTAGFEISFQISVIGE